MKGTTIRLARHRRLCWVQTSLAGVLPAIFLTLLASLTVATAVWAQEGKAASDQPSDQKLPIELEATTSQPPPNDPLQSLTPGEFQGKLVYIARVPVKEPKPHWTHFFVLRRFDQATGAIGTVTTQRVKVSERAFDPQFSPDGDQVLFKVGWPYDRYGSYKLYLWDLRTNRLQRGPRESLTYRRVTWSLDGKYLAYIRGGDVEGNIHWKDDRLELFIYSFETNQSRKVASGRGVRSFAWTLQGTLLYSFWSDTSRQSAPDQARDGEDKADLTIRPDIYEVAAAGGEPKLVVKDGYHPMPSPDGTWIACFTSTDPAKNRTPTTRFVEDSPRQSYLCLYNRMEDKRYIVRPEQGTFSDLRWMPDSKRLITMKATYMATGEGEAQFNIVDVETQNEKLLATLKAKDSRFVTRPNYAPQFIIRDLSKEYLFFEVYEIKSVNQQLKGFSSLKAFALDSNEVATLYEFGSVEGHAWHSEDIK